MPDELVPLLHRLTEAVNNLTARPAPPSADDQDLAAYLHDDLGLEDEASCVPPADEDKASRMLHAITYIDRRKAEVDDTLATHIAWLKRWHAARVAPLVERRAWLEAAVEGWARAVHRDDPTRKTITLAYGTVPIRPRQPKVLVEMTQEDLHLLRKAHPGWVREGKLEPALDPIKKGVAPGKRLDPQPAGVEEGYEAVEAVIAGDVEDGTPDVVVGGVIYLRPLDGVDGKKVTVKPGV